MRKGYFWNSYRIDKEEVTGELKVVLPWDFKDPEEKGLRQNQQSGFFSSTGWYKLPL
jgi:hypothetical protein